MINVSYTRIVNQSQSCQPLLTDSIPIVSCHNRDRREHANLLVNVSYSDRQPIPIPILWATPDSLHMQNWSRPSRAAFHLFVQSIKSDHEGHSILAFRIFWYLWNNQVCKIVWYVMDQEGGWFDHAKVIFQLFTSSGESLVSQWHEGHALVTLIFKVQKLNLYTSQLRFSSLKSCFKRQY